MYIFLGVELLDCIRQISTEDEERITSADVLS